MSRTDLKEVKRFAVKYEPPTLVVEYLNIGSGKTYIKKIRLIGAIGDDATRLTEKIINENDDVLGPSNASRDQILSLMQLIIDKSKTPKVDNKLVTKEYGDLNKASDVRPMTEDYADSISYHSSEVDVINDFFHDYHRS